MSKLLYLEGASGISGDMTVAALLDLGGNREKLDAALRSLRLEGLDYAVSRRKSHGIDGCDFEVKLHEFHGNAEHHGNGHVHGNEHAHGHRNLSDVYAVIDRGELSSRARDLAKKIFRIVAEAEAKAHGCPLDDVHFHEVGALDSIVDIVATAVLIDDLDITECVVAGLSEGSGFVRCQHGELPVPVPAVLNIAQAHKIPLRTSSVQGEMVTPTGIAIAATLRTRSELPKEYTVAKIGIGLGKREFGHANILRAMLIEEKANPEQIWVVECNIDDSTGETLGFAQEKLLACGARDVHFIPCFMKKNRPAYLLRVVVSEAFLPQIEQTIFETTTTIGLRKFPVERTCMARESVDVALPFGTVQVKKCSWNGIVRAYPEYESVKQLAESSGVDFLAIFAQAKQSLES